ncbi:uncharacterized protein LOC110237116 isoform X2 [Exaiptasia diaphana]|uniref:C-terminal of Roc (COR) domain-containing protein n=1 Tax=Exaiptasia diaphana TaxID=2652724 RepID=A0A913X3H4_EXADI|nr:uncharacterized protein LOC110237116 isoform X2 [Exaiptasia diaphana]
MNKFLDHIMEDPKYAYAEEVVYAHKLYDSINKRLSIGHKSGVRGIIFGAFVAQLQVRDILVIVVLWKCTSFDYINDCVLSLLISHGLFGHKSPEESQSRKFDFIRVVNERKSRILNFHAHLACVTSQEQVEKTLQQLKRDSKISDATYLTHTLAYRFFDKEKKSFLEESRGDGENVVCKKLLHLLQICKVQNVLVIVTHWQFHYWSKNPGVYNIGPENDMHINSCALEVIKMANEAGVIQTSAPLEIICRGQQALAAYDNALLNGKTKNRRLFLMLIGPSRSGKTSLLKSLKGEVFDPDEDSTDLIALNRYCCKLIDGIWVKDGASEDEVSFDSVVSKDIAKNYQSEPNVVGEGKRSTSADGRTNFDKKIDEKANPVVEMQKEGSGIFLLVHNLENDAYGLAAPVAKKGNARRKVVDKCSMTNMDHLEFWLSFVALNATRQSHNASVNCKVLPKKLPPVFLACTHADMPFGGQKMPGKCYENATKMSREILKHLKTNEHIPGEHLVSCLYPVDNTVSGSSEDEGVRRLRKDICEVAKCLPYMNEDIPVRWFRFEKELSSLVQVGKIRYLSTDEAKKIALDCKVDVESDEFFTLLNYLHDIREIIFFEGTETVFIDTQWLINMISRVITVEPFENWQEEQTDSWTKLENKGVLDVSLLEYVWREIADDKHAIDSLLVIMEKFSLVCRWKIDDKEDVFLVPAMLMNSSAQDIAELLKDQMPPLIVYFPSSHLPLGIFPRVQVLFAELCNRKWPSSRPPKFFHNFCRFFSIGEDESFDLVLTSDIRTILIGVINNNEADDQKISDFCQEIIGFLKTKLGTDMRKDFPWMERMKYNLCIHCPICKPSPDCDLPHVPGCVSPACVHFITEEEILKEKRLRCLENPTSKVTDIPCEYFHHWFPKPEKPAASQPIHGAGPRTVPIGMISTTGSLSLDENSKRWVVVGIAIMKVLLPALRNFVLPKITKHYNDLKTNHNIDTQVFGTHLKMDGTYKFNYDSINSNQGKKPPLFDYRVTSEVDLAKLCLKPFMAKFTGIDETCDLSAVLGILSSASVFLPATQAAAKDVRQYVRNEWGHCNFTEWDEVKIADCFKFMDVLVKSLILADEEEKKLLEELKEWEENGVALCLRNPPDGGLLNVYENVSLVLKEVQSLKESNPEEFQRITSALEAFKEEVIKCLKKLEEGQEDIKARLTDIASGVNDVKSLLELSLASGRHEIRQSARALELSYNSYL